MADSESIQPAQKKSLARTIREYTEALAFAFILAMIIRHYVVEAFKIPTGSMEPTLMGDPSQGDKILVSKFMYDITRPQRWDVFVFKYPQDPEKNYIKRLAGLPGETLRLNRGNLFVNGKIARKPAKVQKELWRLVTDERLARSEQLLHELNILKARLVQKGLPGLDEYESRANSLPAERWRREVRDYELDAQLRQLEDGVSPEFLWRKSLSSSVKRIHRFASEISAAGGSSSPVTFRAWYDAYLGAVKAPDGEVEQESSELLADRDGLLTRAIERQWKFDRGSKVCSGGKVLMDGSANPLGGVSMTYRFPVRDGRFNNNLDMIAAGDPPGTFWQGRFGEPRHVVGDVRLVADIEPESDPTELTLIIVDDGAEHACRIRRSGHQLSFDFEAFGGPTNVPTVIVPFNGKPCRVNFANVDDSLQLAVDGKPRSEFLFETAPPRPGGASSVGFNCRRGEVTVDNVELYRDLYYRNDSGLLAPGNEVKLRDREYFALGDNSPSSNDSRMWGVVPEENLVGEAFLVIWPVWRVRIIR